MGLESRSCFVYLDDILVVSRTFEEHLHRLQAGFERMRKTGLRLKPSKCHLFQEEVLFLGDVVSASGIKPDPAKTTKVMSYPTPTDSTKVRPFLGLASYYRRFVSALQELLIPFIALRRRTLASCGVLIVSLHSPD